MKIRHILFVTAFFFIACSDDNSNPDTGPSTDGIKPEVSTTEGGAKKEAGVPEEAGPKREQSPQLQPGHQLP